jgi:arylsulfatase
VLYASGNENSGLVLFVIDDQLVFDYNCFGDHHVVRSDRSVPEGRSVVGVEFRRAKVSGEATLVIDGEACGTLPIPFVMRMISSVGTSVGRDHGSQVSKEYQGESPFEGTLHQVDVQLISLSERDKRAAAEAEARAAMARQ